MAILEELLRRHPELGSGIRRTLERRIRRWRALHGAEREVIFRQVPEPGASIRTGVSSAKLAALMEGSREDVLAYMDFPSEHWPQIAFTNPPERVNKVIKRCVDVVGILPNDSAIVWLVEALMLETNDEWTVARRYIGLESLDRITDTPNRRFPAVAALPKRSFSEDRRS